MKPTSRAGSVAASIATLALACALGSASAQEIPKPVDVDGNSASSDKPPPRKTGFLPRRIGKVDVSEATRRLEHAQMARQQGLEPRPGEFVQVSGARTVNYRYWKRQEKLRVAVEQAQRRSQATHRVVTRTQPKVSQI